jgi:nucleotide-binding universal stress UspA family protein
MFQRILVPLDGSKRAECALLVAARLARASGGSIVLLRVVAIPGRYGAYMYESYLSQSPVFLQEVLDVETVKAKEYLADVTQLPVLAGIATETEVLSGATEPAIEISAHERHVDLVVMCSHGDTGFKRWVVGSLSQKLARHSPVPVLVLHEGGTLPIRPFPDRSRPLRTLMGLVALDGSALAEAALVPAAQLVASLAAPARGILLLTRVVNLPQNADDQGRGAHVDPRLKEEALEEARTYLSAVADRQRKSLLPDLKLSLLVSVAAGKDVANTLLTVAEHSEDAEGNLPLGSCDLMVMATHGRSGLQRLALGSVTERVLGAAKLPVLVIRPQDVQAMTEHEPFSDGKAVEKTQVEVPNWKALF